MITWYEKLYISEKAYPNRKAIIDAVDSSRPIPGAYILALRTCETDQLDIMDMSQLLIPGVRKRLGTIIGIAMGRSDAYELLTNIAQQVYAETGDLYIRAYLTEKINGRPSVHKQKKYHRKRNRK